MVSVIKVYHFLLQKSVSIFLLFVIRTNNKIIHNPKFTSCINSNLNFTDHLLLMFLWLRIHIIELSGESETSCKLGQLQNIYSRKKYLLNANWWLWARINLGLHLMFRGMEEILSVALFWSRWRNLLTFGMCLILATHFWVMWWLL